MSTPTRPPPARSSPPGTSAKPFSIRLTEEEKQLLLRRAGKLPLGTYLRELILDGEARAARCRKVNPVKDHEALARVLAGLGQSALAGNLSRLAKAAQIGALSIAPETEHDIGKACAAVIAMRGDLMRALGLTDGGR